MVVTMKFTGEEPNFDAIDEAVAAATQHGYRCRAMHHFSNKNEVSLMLIEPEVQPTQRSTSYVSAP